MPVFYFGGGRHASFPQKPVVKSSEYLFFIPALDRATNQTQYSLHRIEKLTTVFWWETLNVLNFRNYKSWMKFQIRDQNFYNLIVHRRGRKNEMSSHPSTCNSQWTKTKIFVQKLLGKTKSNVYLYSRVYPYPYHSKGKGRVGF